MSALPPKVDIRQRIEHACFVPAESGSGARGPKLLNLNANLALAGVNGSGKSNSGVTGLVGSPASTPVAVTHKDRPKLALFVLAAGAVLLGAAALQSVLIVGPGPGSSSPHTISVDTSRPATTPAPASTPRPWNSPSEKTEKPKVETPPAQSKPAPQPEPSPIAKGEPEEKSEPAAKVETPPVELKPSPALVQAPPAPENKPAIAAEPKVEMPPSEVKPAPKPEPSQIAKSAPEEAKPEPVPAVAPKSKVKEAAADVKPLKQKRAPETKIIATEAKPELAQPKTEIGRASCRERV